MISVRENRLRSLYYTMTHSECGIDDEWKTVGKFLEYANKSGLESVRRKDRSKPYGPDNLAIPVKNNMVRVDAMYVPLEIYKSEKFQQLLGAIRMLANWHA